MNKPITRQRMERLILTKSFLGAGNVPLLGMQSALNILLAEHRRLRAKVRKLRNGAVASKFLHIEEAVGYKIACDDILKALR